MIVSRKNELNVINTLNYNDIDSDLISQNNFLF